MTEYYFDIETTGTCPQHHKIITIQWQRVDKITGKPLNELQILKEWESSEIKILTEFLPNFMCERPFDFVFVGENLLFDFTFLSTRFERYGLGKLDLHYWYERPFVDVKPILVAINKCSFVGYNILIKKDSALAEMNKKIPQYYKEKKYPEIMEYIKEESKAFLKAYQVLKKKMPSLAKHLLK